MPYPLATLFAVLVSHGPAVAPEPTPRPVFEPVEYAFAPYRLCALHGEEDVEWRFSVENYQGGGRLHMMKRVGSVDEPVPTNGFSPTMLGDVIGVTAGMRGAMASLGVASLTEDGERVEFRILFHGQIGAEKYRWAVSPVMITIPCDDDYLSMSMAMPQGDTLVFQIQRLQRDDLTTFETHTFINVCPMPWSLDALTHYYHTSSAAPFEQSVKAAIELRETLGLELGDDAVSRRIREGKDSSSAD
jgi:hypothetical protein